MLVCCQAFLYSERMVTDGSLTIHKKDGLTNRPANYTPCIAFDANLKREDLGRVEPRHSQPRRAKNDGEQENHSDGSIAGLTLFRTGPGIGQDDKAAGEEECDTLTDTAPVQGPAASDPVQCKYTDQGGQHVSDGVESSDPL